MHHEGLRVPHLMPIEQVTEAVLSLLAESRGEGVVKVGLTS